MLKEVLEKLLKLFEGWSINDEMLKFKLKMFSMKFLEIFLNCQNLNCDGSYDSPLMEAFKPFPCKKRFKALNETKEKLPTTSKWILSNSSRTFNHLPTHWEKSQRFPRSIPVNSLPDLYNKGHSKIEGNFAFKFFCARFFNYFLFNHILLREERENCSFSLKQLLNGKISL